MSGLEVGTRLSHYEVQGEVSRGGMGIVYRARDLKLGREVALKVLPADLVADPQRRRRFTLEARAAAQLEHPHIGVVYEIDEADGVTFIAMELIRGEKLSDAIAGPPLPLARTLVLATEVAEGLAHAHERGIVHRDLKPGNVLLTEDGHAKIIDFGLAKLVEPMEATDDHDETASTETGTVIGTPDYMAPEQALGQRVDHRSDLFSFGVMLYQMLSRGLPFRGKSRLETLNAILSAPAPPLKLVSGEEAPDLQRILDKCLAKEPVERYQGTRDLVVDLRGARRRIESASGPAAALPPAPTAHRLLLTMQPPWLAAAALLILLAAVAVAIQLGVQGSRARWARNVALPEIARLAKEERLQAAFGLAREAAQHIPDDPQLQQQIKEITHLTSIKSEPSGAQAYFADYLDAAAQWDLAGTTPIESTRVPYGNVRWKLTREGYEELLTTAWAGSGSLDFRLSKLGTVPAGMVRVQGGPSDWYGVRNFDLEDFWLDRYEVTNADFKRFVDAGGYEKREYWKEPFVLASRTLSWEEASAHLRDRTGRPGPATWTLGSFPEGEAEHPVGGVSWYEAAAYAGFAGKSLPTIYHWQRAALSSEFPMFSDMLRLANFSGTGPKPVGRSRSLSHSGVYDIAGNVKEWGWNAVAGRRFLLGGAWNEPVYMGPQLPEPTPPFDRAPTYGFRCARYTQSPSAGMLAPLELPKPGLKPRLRPVDDETFRVYQDLYSYEHRDLRPEVERIEETVEWRQETVSYDAGYAGERVVAQLFLPKHAAPPYQAVIYFPHYWALKLRNSHEMETRWVSFFVRSGRALLCPVFKGMYERRAKSDTEDYYAEWSIAWAKEVRRSIDYLETRKDVDPKRIAYYGWSLGAHIGPLFAAVEKRLQTLILLGGGLFPGELPPQVDPVHFVPRTHVPVLMVNGKDDFWMKEPTDRLFGLLGTPPNQKRLVRLEGGHHPARLEDVIREALDWLDRTLGPVRRG